MALWLRYVEDGVFYGVRWCGHSPVLVAVRCFSVCWGTASLAGELRFALGVFFCFLFCFFFALTGGGNYFTTS